MIRHTPSVLTRTLHHPVDPVDALRAVHLRDRPLLARFADHTVVAAEPAQVVEGQEVWDALDIPWRSPSAGHTAAAGGWFGLLSYDLAGTIERLPPPRPDHDGPPIASVGRYDTVALIAADGGCTLATCRGEHELDRMESALTSVPVPPPFTEPETVPAPQASLPAARYLASVERIRELIRAGDCYQVNLTKRLSTSWHSGPLALADQLWAETGPTSHRAYLGLPQGTVVSASPERLVVTRDGVALAEPIKGTAPVGAWAQLSTSVKDRAEHVMIVDLLRNDLGRVAVAGGVDVPELFAHLPTPYVEHMVSRIRARLRPDATAAQVLRAVFPSGSVTGTPKVRAMEIINQLEPVSRGPAFGSVIGVGTDGAIESSVTIRTAWVTEHEVRYWCGGAVVWDSQADAELAEAGAKAAPFLRAVTHP